VNLLDPFAGFGSIPLEALRLGLSAAAVELLPTAYVFLKAVLEYPTKYGKRLVRDVEKWGNWVTEIIDLDTLKLLKNIELYQCLIIGNLTEDFPILIKVTPQKDVMMGGETQRLFD